MTGMENSAFELFANRVGQFVMKKFVVPYLRGVGNVGSYRATVVSVDSSTGTMQIQRPYDTVITLPYAAGAASLQAGDFCTVLTLGESSNSVVVADGKLNESYQGGGGTIPTKISQLENDVGFITASEVPKEIWYGTSDTAATTAAKVVTTNTGDFELVTGAMVRVKFTNGNTYNGTATLNVDSTGAVDIARVGTTKTTRYYWGTGEVVDLVYDGSNFVMSNKCTAGGTYYGLTKLATAVGSNVSTVAATPSLIDAKLAAKVPDAPAAAGSYTLHCTVDSGGNAVYSWS